MSAVLRPSTTSHVAAMLGRESFEASLVRQRIMTRAEYNDARKSAHTAQIESQLLMNSMPRAALADAAYARRLRSEISPPIDVPEAKRAKRWVHLGEALRLACQAKATLTTARKIARMVRA